MTNEIKIKQSKLAVWSFILSLTPITLFFVIILLVILLEQFAIIELLGGILVFLYFSLILYATAPIALISLVLAIASFFEIRKYNLKGIWIAITGVIISLILIIFEIYLWVFSNGNFYRMG